MPNRVLRELMEAISPARASRRPLLTAGACPRRAIGGGRLGVRAAMGTGALVCLVPLLGAQAPPSARADTRTDTLADAARWATVTTDTGDYAPGHRDFSRYTTMQLCHAAARSELGYQRWTVAAQALVDSLRHVAPERDTLPARMHAVVGACLTRFPVAKVAESELAEFFDLALLTQDNSLIHAAEQRMLAVQYTPVVQSWQFANILALPSRYVNTRVYNIPFLLLNELLQAEPARVVQAESLVAQIDAEGRGALVDRVSAHVRLAEFFNDIGQSARFRHEADQVFALAQDATTGEMLEGNRTHRGVYQELRPTFENVVESAYLTHPDSMQLLVRQMDRLLQQPDKVRFVYERYRPESEIGDPLWDDPFHTSSHVHEDEAIKLREVTTKNISHLWNTDEILWFPAGSETLRYPVPGTVSLFMRFPDNALTSPDVALLTASQDLHVLQEWQRRFGPAGLKITVLAVAQGYNAFVGPQTAQDEAEFIRWYIQDFLHIPATVGVLPASSIQRPVGDGRWVEDSTDASRKGLRYGRWYVGRNLLNLNSTNKYLYQTFKVANDFDVLAQAPIPVEHPNENIIGQAPFVLTGGDGARIAGNLHFFGFVDPELQEPTNRAYDLAHAFFERLQHPGQSPVPSSSKPSQP